MDVEQPTVVEDVPARPSSATTSGRDPYADDRPNGSANLDEFPPNQTELFYASELFRDPTDFVAARYLRQLTGSAPRAAAVLRQVKRAADAQRTLDRIQGGPK